MIYVNEMKLKYGGIIVYIVKIEKFKIVLLMFKMLVFLMKEFVIKRVLFLYVFFCGIESWLKMVDLCFYFDELYGIFVFVDLIKKGECYVIMFWFEIFNEKYLKDCILLLEKGF